MTIGLVGNARYGGDITGGLFANSGGLCDPLLDALDFGAGVEAAVLLNGNLNFRFSFLESTRCHTHLGVYCCNNVAYGRDMFWYLKILCRNRYSIDRFAESAKLKFFCYTSVLFARHDKSLNT